MEQTLYHVPVLLHETIEALQIKPSGVYIDCTFGGGGHSKMILEELGKDGRLIVFDQDKDSMANVPDDSRVTFIPHNFRHLQRFLRLEKVTSVSGILADLGVSSHQINMPERGFSTRYDAELDMRMNQSGPIKAADILKNYTEEKLHKIFEQYGSLPHLPNH
jgi:16S rRNA (cytosine1402-N4)-methyltransferase